VIPQLLGRRRVQPACVLLIHVLCTEIVSLRADLRNIVPFLFADGCRRSLRVHNHAQARGTAHHAQRAKSEKLHRRERPNVSKTGVLGFEAKLWAAADALRNNMDAAEYKYVVLGLIFLKYISDALVAKHAELAAQTAQGADAEDPDKCRAVNFAWVQHFIYYLAPTGLAGFVLANGSMSSNQSSDGEIRKAIIEAALVDCMVALPGQLFYSTPIPVCCGFSKPWQRGVHSGGPARHRTPLHHADCKSCFGHEPQASCHMNAPPSWRIVPWLCNRFRTSGTKSKYPAAAPP
jgi:N-6 DNA methylase/HsdM-like protein